MKHYKVPGLSAAFVHNEKLVWAKGFGVVETGSEKPVTTETIFQAVSISKPFTAMVALHLRRGKTSTVAEAKSGRGHLLIQTRLTTPCTPTRRSAPLSHIVNLPND